jgi:hypothetical protein
MQKYEHFELLRQSDDLVYQFDRQKRSDGSYGYKRRDLDIWIIQSPQYGWIAISPEDEINGIPWGILPEEQQDFPPECDWVSKKGSKSYVYSLVYLEVES